MRQCRLLMPCKVRVALAVPPWRGRRLERRRRRMLRIMGVLWMVLLLLLLLL